MQPKLETPSDKLRPYQHRALRDIDRAFRRYRRVIFVEFMGTGKTVVAAAYVRRRVGEGRKVLILVHRSEILKQTLRKLQRAGIPASMIGVVWSDSGATARSC